MTAGGSPGVAGAVRDAAAGPTETGFDTRLYERFPTQGERPPEELEALKKVWETPKGWRAFSAVNNNFIGFLFIVTAFGFFIAAGILSLVMRVQLAAPMAAVVPQETYNQLFTMHGSVMMFLFAVPAVEAIAVMLLPQMLAARDLPFPRLSAYSYWAYAIGGTVFFGSIFFSLAPSDGWFMYPPLSSGVYSKGINADFWLLGIGFIEISAIAGAIELIVGVLRTRAPGMTLTKMPVYAWAILIFGVMIILAFPAMIMVTFLLELERAFNWPLFDATRGGDPLLYQHLFWFFGHPDVYIIFIPASAMVSTMIVTVAQKKLVGHELVVLAMIATGFISFGVWAHHMFTVGLPELSAGYFSAASMAVAIPAGAQVFAWICTLASGKVQRNVPSLFLVGGILIFVMGGLTGVMVGMVAFDGQAHDTYFVVAHFHYVLIGGMVFPLFAGFYYWTPMINGRQLSEKLGRWVFWLSFVGVHVTFLPMHLSGLMGMPRRVNTYLPDRDWDLPNLVSTVGAFIMAAGVLLFLIDAVRCYARQGGSGGDARNVFNGGTLEWLSAGNYSVRSIPVVNDLEPLWTDPRMAKDVEAGRYFLPNTATGARETLITSTLRAEPQYVQIMPGPSWWPVLSALFTAGFFLLLTVKAMTLSAICGVLTVFCLMRWVWGNDRHIAEKQVDAGAGILLPTYVAGPASHGWWAAMLLNIVLGMIFLMAMFAYLYLFGAHPDWWRIPAPRGVVLPGLLLLSASAGLAWAARPLIARLKRGSGISAALMTLSMLCLVAALAVDALAWWQAGLRGDASGQGAAVYAMLAWHGAIVTAVVLSAFYYALRWMRGLAPGPANKTLEALRLLFIYAALEGTAGLLLPRLLPWGAA
ncbi:MULTISPECIES: cbb3-type cytochrome c oxidase subunit I [unclassified Roseateles]|uniref:cbb3-type cytochrome c oxidase subunit I n=1 Tax=unclassified Roseateles TaxID=2626991 RepID=UPI0007005E07|nr:MULTISPECIES: cbb3-type cytochrome c oxidase subunit I [unclassified Roseateles]KQW50020.1 cytochrome B [Pelomonas sp. Root405]KRA67420.1 cytochrome B [Pelomonas sp. Root662]